MDPTKQLKLACGAGDTEKVNEILRSSPRKLSQAGLDEGLEAAAFRNQPEVVELMLSGGAYITNHAVIGACSNENPVIFQHFIDHGFDVNRTLDGLVSERNRRDYRPNPVLRLVVGSESCTRLLLEHGADPNVLATRGVTPLATAVASDSPLAVMELLVSYGAEMGNSKDVFLDAMTREGDNVAITKFVLEHGIDANTPTRRGPPLHCAVDYGDKEIVRCLLEHGADRTAISLGKTALELAEEKGDTDIVSLLSEPLYAIHTLDVPQ